MQVGAGLVMDADPVGPRLGEGGDEFIGVIDHQMAVERETGGFPQAGDDRRSQGQIGDKVAVHDIDVDGGAAAPLGRGDLIGQAGKIRREDGGQQFDHMTQGVTPCGDSVSAEQVRTIIEASSRFAGSRR